MGPKKKPGRKVLAHSEYNTLSARYGPPPERNGRPWMPDDNDCLFESYLVRGLRNLYAPPGYDTLPSVCDRTKQSVKTQWWKVIREYGSNSKAYLPGAGRTDRSGQPLTRRDLAVLWMGFYPEARKSLTLEHHAALLCRTMAEVLEWVESQAAQWATVPRVGGESPWDAAVRRIIATDKWVRIVADEALNYK